MNILYFDVFCQVAQVKSFSKAAKLLHISQPAISSQIQSMEDYYGAKLFDRTSQGVTLTAAGKIVYDYARQLLKIHETMEREVTATLTTAAQSLTLGASQTVGNYALACSIWTFKEKFPEIKLKLEIANTEALSKKITDRSIDIAIAEGFFTPEHPGVVVREICRDEIVAIVPASEAWLEKKSITLQEICRNDLILDEQNSDITYVLERAMQKAGVCTKGLGKVTTFSSIDAIKSAIEAGHGISVCCRLAVQKDVRRGSLIALPIANIPLSMPINIIGTPERLDSFVVKRFLRFIMQSNELQVC